jgi:hypothetical protein
MWPLRPFAVLSILYFFFGAFLEWRSRKPVHGLGRRPNDGLERMLHAPYPSPLVRCRSFWSGVESNVRHRTISLRCRLKGRSVAVERRGREARRIKMSDSPYDAAMGSFVTRENIKRYRKLVDESTSAAERSRILSLLTEEEAKFKLGQNRGSDPPGG